MTPEQKVILDKLKLNGRLPAPKGVALEVINLTQRENVSNQQIARLISADPGLSVRVIKAANMLLSSTCRPVVNIADAVTVLGGRALRQLVLGISLIVDYHHGPCKQFNYANFWAHSLLTGIIIRNLAARSRLAAAEEIFVVGLLSDIGSLAFATAFPVEFSALLEEGGAPEATYEKERTQFGFDQAELSAAILADMNFPPIFQNLVRGHSNLSSPQTSQGGREEKLKGLLILASLMAEVYLSPVENRFELVKKLRELSASADIDASTLVEVSEDCANEWPAWTAMLNMGERQLPVLATLFEQIEEGVVSAALKWERLPDDYKMRVLVVHEDKKLRKELEKVLQEVGHQATFVANNEEALAKFDLVRPQLIVADCVSPSAVTDRLCQKVVALRESTPLYLLVTVASQSIDELSKVFRSGADDYLPFPWVPEVFLARLRVAQRVVQLQSELVFDREQLLRFKTELSAANERLNVQALTDALTGLPNRRFAMEKFEQEWILSQRGHRPISCLMVDVDHFKKINDQYGHQVGDVALKQVAASLSAAVRPQDVVCRYGGEEFLVICPDTEPDIAYQCAEKIRLAIAARSLQLRNREVLSMTVSVGLATKTELAMSIEDFLSRVDANLYAAKAAGRNCTVMR